MPGDIMIFWQNTPHYGVRNCSIQPRVALFTMPSLHSGQEQDADDKYQFFRWMFKAEAFGKKSKEFALAMVDDKQHDPVGRFEREERAQAVECLQLHRLYDAYYSDGRRLRVR